MLRPTEQAHRSDCSAATRRLALATRCTTAWRKHCMGSFSICPKMTLLTVTQMSLFCTARPRSVLAWAGLSPGWLCYAFPFPACRMCSYSSLTHVERPHCSMCSITYLVAGVLPDMIVAALVVEARRGAQHHRHGDSHRCSGRRGDEGYLRE